jgi:hypothetical protein
VEEVTGIGWPEAYVLVALSLIPAATLVAIFVIVERGNRNNDK